ncbi:16S rRNA (cytosine(967)-C(5))-methyltransferase RsmB [Rodentibacter myodis]|uniref:16S rRNA (cytosine(967)-C(5))-methyltransferase n=1 Tax=Rodentibacter myodis TaxID=1907939 RepID=A0A1V3JMK8_9PAST|nr:16S rRNA (cytosine(967)-C(5))-methyltransferase RsmB [Rodentibacter myodis]OOF58040.1 16S rRNA (cytosine(967)-C(5))-methyltransferase [Rodentibacter myodis]
MKKFRSPKKTPSKTPSKLTTLSSRAIAAQVILQVLDEGKSLSALLPEVQSEVKTQDLALLQEICFGVCRVLPRLEQIIQRLVDKPLKGKTRIVHCLLLVGLYQLLYLRVPAHAAVDEVVNATKLLKVDSFRGLVNGVLRRFLREQEDILAIVDKHWQTLHPEWFVNKLKKAYRNWREIIEANNQKPPMWLRVNSQKNSTENYRTLLMDTEISAEMGVHPQSLRLASPVAVQKLPQFVEGAVTVQDLSAQWAATLLEPQNSEWILDACAAPGGKTTHILELAPQAKVIALDVEAHRLKRVEENLARLNQQAIVVCGDASQPDDWLGEIEQNTVKSAVKFDRILLDAPCSATGVIRRHPDIKWLRQETDIAQLVELQKKILNALWAKLKPNGILLYATCSVLPDENSDQIKAFLAEHAEAELLPLPFDDDQSVVGFQFIPQEKSGDGFYYAKLRKRA